MKHVVGVDYLRSQRIIHTLCLTGALQVDAVFATFAIIRRGSPSYHVMKTKYPNMSQDRMDSILVVVADKLGIYERVAEEIIGNMGKSEARRNADSEPSTPRQTLLFATKHHFAETTYVGKCKVVKRKPKEPDMFAPKRDAKEARWWRIVPISVRDRSTIQQLQ